MAYNTRSIKRDVDGRPVPQYFNSTIDDYEPLLGENGAARSVLYGPNGQPINSSNPLPTKDDALAALLGELNNAPVTDPSATSATVLQLLRGLLAVAGRETTLAAVKAAIDELTARAATEETLSATRDALDSLAQRGLATEVTLAQAAQALATLAGTVDAGAQQVTLSGRSVKHFATLLTNTPLAARGEAGSIYTSSVRDLTADGAHLGYGLTIFSDTFCVVRMSVWNPAGNYLQENNTLWFGVWPNLLTWLPPFRPPLTRWIWRVDNLANVPQTQLAVHEVATDYLPYSPANLRAVLCYNLAIRDTNLHLYTTDPNNMVQFRRTLIGGAKSPVLINNQLNQAVRAQLYLTTIGIGSGKVYEVDVPAGSTVYITNQEVPALDVPYEEIHVRLQCTTAPTSGTVSVVVDSLVGGTA